VTRGKDEAVSIRPQWIGGIVVQKIVPQRIDHRCEPHGRAGVARIGFLNGINRKSADGVDTKLIKIRLTHNISEAGNGAPAIGIQGLDALAAKKTTELYCKSSTLACPLC
jgi:hypothetical protein